MADLRESFPILEDDATGEGQAPVARTEGEASAAKEGLIGFSFKDSDGNVVLPQLTPTGKLPVDTEATNSICKNNRGENAGSLVEVTIATITLTPSKVISNVGYLVSCFREALFQVVHNDNGTETVIADALVGPGAYTHCSQLKCLEFTSGAVGTQQLLLKAINTGNKISQLRGTITLDEAV